MRAGLASIPPRWFAAAAAVVTYAVVTHAVMTQSGDSPWTPVFALGPAVGLGMLALWRAGLRLLVSLCVAAVLLLVIFATQGHALPSRWLYLAQHAGIHLALAVWFGSTLRMGVQPLISSLAQRVHGMLSPPVAAYTRNVTLAWTLYFVTVAAVSIVLFFFGDFSDWSLLANLLTPVFTTSMFVGEYLLRYRLHPEFERISLHRVFQAWNTPHAANSGADAEPSDR